jgi:hypothetical protein
MAICHHVNDVPTAEFPEPGFARLSYSDFQKITDRSRPKISGGLKKLVELNLIEADKAAKANVYKIVRYDPEKKWAKLPLKYLYGKNYPEIAVFHKFNFRSKVELDALKLYLLFIAFRNNELNHAIISYEKISQYTGISENNIRSAVSLLINLDLISIDKIQNAQVRSRMNNLYRIKGIRSRKHLGNISLDTVEAELAAAVEAELPF